MSKPQKKPQSLPEIQLDVWHQLLENAIADEKYWIGKVRDARVRVLAAKRAIKRLS